MKYMSYITGQICRHLSPNGKNYNTMSGLSDISPNLGHTSPGLKIIFRELVEFSSMIVIAIRVSYKKYRHYLLTTPLHSANVHIK